MQLVPVWDIYIINRCTMEVLNVTIVTNIQLIIVFTDDPIWRCCPWEDPNNIKIHSWHYVLVVNSAKPMRHDTAHLLAGKWLEWDPPTCTGEPLRAFARATILDYGDIFLMTSYVNAINSSSAALSASMHVAMKWRREAEMEGDTEVLYSRMALKNLLKFRWR